QVSGLYGTLTGIETMTEHKAERAPWGDFPAVVRNGDLKDLSKEGANKQVISSQADSLIKISRIWADFFPANTSNQPI
ncbi:hypothetical protein, partial [Klebsiella sp. 131256]|uniref:hypothetical protein n=1 Tax=Klebsiella sp. 131256 TaxID=3079245 RepID=UPI0030069DDE